MAGKLRAAAVCALVTLLVNEPMWAWGRDGHLMINRLAIQYLPTDVPLFLRSAHAMDVVEYLGPEPDRWKGKGEPELSYVQSPDHFLDEEWADLAGTPCQPAAAGCSPAGTLLPRRRRDFVNALADAQKTHPELNLDPGKVGFLPYQTEEVWERLKSDLRDYRKLEATHGDTAGAEVAILFDCGWLGHYVADGSQPLHVTIQYNGWTGANPNGYSTDRNFHANFESVFVSAHVKRADVAPLVAVARPAAIGDEWTQFLDYVHHTHSLVEKTYQLDKTGAFTGVGTPEGKAFVAQQLAAGAIELRDLIYSAWVHSADPVEEYKGPQ